MRRIPFGKRRAVRRKAYHEQSRPTGRCKPPVNAQFYSPPFQGSFYRQHVHGALPRAIAASPLGCFIINFDRSVFHATFAKMPPRTQCKNPLRSWRRKSWRSLRGILVAFVARNHGKYIFSRNSGSVSHSHRDFPEGFTFSLIRDG